MIYKLIAAQERVKPIDVIDLVTVNVDRIEKILKSQTRELVTELRLIRDEVRKLKLAA